MFVVLFRRQLHLQEKLDGGGRCCHDAAEKSLNLSLRLSLFLSFELTLNRDLCAYGGAAFAGTGTEKKQQSQHANLNANVKQRPLKPVQVKTSSKELQI